MNNKQKLAETFLVPALAGSIAAATSYFVFDEDGDLPILGMKVPGWAGIGGVVFGSLLIGNVAGNWVLPYIPGNVKFANMEKLLVVPVATGASTAALMYFAVPTARGQLLMKSFAIGAISEIGAQYGVDIVKSYISMNK